MTIEEAKKELECYKNLERIIDQRRAWIKERKSTVSKVTSTLSNEPKGTRKCNDSMAENLTNILDIEAETETKIQKLELQKKHIYNKISKLEEPYQELLFNNYIIGLTVENTGEVMGYSRAQIFRLKKDSLIEYTKIT